MSSELVATQNVVDRPVVAYQLVTLKLVQKFGVNCLAIYIVT